jgi:hypothetical protein
MHTEDSLKLLEENTKELGDLLRHFRNLTCSQFSTVELPREADARVRRRKEATNAQRPHAAPAGVPPPVMENGSADGENRGRNAIPENQVPTGKFAFYLFWFLS